MPASKTQLAIDLEALLSRALSRSGTGAWEGALEAITRASTIMPALVGSSGSGDLPDTRLRRCGELLGTLRATMLQAQDAAREELNQIRYARSRLQPTRSAYGATGTAATRSRFTSSA